MRHLIPSAVAAFVCVSVVTAQQAVAPVEILVTGRVCDPDGAPIPGACLTVASSTGPTTQELLEKPQHVAGADGSFKVTVPRYHRLIATAKGRLALGVQITSREPELVLGDFVLPPGVTWFGRVRAPDGKPVAGVRVQVTDVLAQHGHVFGPQFTVAAGAATGADGIFRLEGVPANGLALAFKAPGWLPERIALADRSTPIAIEMKPTVWCRGRLEARPANASLQAFAEEGGRFEGTIADDGTFAVDVPGDQRYRVFCHSAALPGGMVWSKILSGAQDQVTLGAAGERVAALLVHVVDEATRQPVAEFGIDAHWEFQHSLHAGHLYGSDPMNEDRGRNGVIQLQPSANWQEGQGILFVRAPGHGEVFFDVSKPKELPNREPIVITLPAERRVSGTVCDANGKPVAGAEVWAVPISDGSLGYSYKPANLVRTDADGKFTVSGLGPRRYAVQAFADGCKLPAAIDVDLAQETAPVQVRLEHGKSKEIKWRNRPPGAGWFCTVANLSHSPGGSANWHNDNPIVWRAIDPDHPLQMPDLGEGTQLYVARPSRGRVASALLFDCTGMEVIDLAALQPGMLSGRIALPEALRGQVMLSAVPMTDSGNLQRSYRTPVALDGSYELELPPGKFQLGVEAMPGQMPCWHHGDELQIEGGRTVRLDLQPDIGWLRLELTPHRDGAPLRTTYVLVMSTGARGRHHHYVHLEARPLVVLPATQGPCKVTLYSHARSLAVDEQYSNTELGSEEVEVETGREAVVKLQEPPPAPAPPANGAK